MSFDLTIGIGDIVAFLLFIAAGVALILQRHSNKLAEKKLKTEIEDVKTLANETKELANRIEKESQLREADILKNMSYYADSINYGTYILQNYIKNSTTLESGFIKYFQTLIVIIKVIVKSMDIGREKSKGAALIEKFLGSMIVHMHIGQEWQNELNNSAQENEKRRKEIGEENLQNAEVKRLFDKEIIRYKQKIDEITKKYSPLVESSGSFFIEVQKEFLEYMKDK